MSFKASNPRAFLRGSRSVELYERGCLGMQYSVPACGIQVSSLIGDKVSVSLPKSILTGKGVAKM